MTNVLSAPDYIVIAAMMAISTAIGIFFAVRSRRGHQLSNDYFLGSQAMPLVPVAFSISATVISSVTYLGVPSEVYLYGPKFGLILLARLYTPLMVAFFFVPVYYRLKVTTVFEYLGLRFGNAVRYSMVPIQFINGLLYMGVVLYAPSLALSLAAGISLPVSILSIAMICTFYTTIGGIKAVIWTDVFQASSMLLGLLVMIVVGTVTFGGPAEGWRRTVEGDRGDLVDFQIDPTIRFTFWSIIIGGTFSSLSLGNSQNLVQRFNTCRSERDAKLSCWLGMSGMALFELLAVATGMTAFAYYYKCDPLTSGQISLPDQIVPFFILDLLHSYPCVPGLLIGGVFSASLSSMSSMLNGLVATVGIDIVKRIWPHLSDSRYAVIIKVTSVAFGLLSVALAFLVSALGNILPTVFALGGVTSGPRMGVFILGMFFPRANSIGAMFGLIGGTTIGIVQYVGSQAFPSPRLLPPLSVDGCVVNSNESYELFTGITYAGEITIHATIQSTVSSDTLAQSPAFFSLSYLYIMVLTCCTCVITGVVVSYATSLKNPRMADPALLSPLVASFYANNNNINTNIKTGPKTEEPNNIGLDPM